MSCFSLSFPKALVVSAMAFMACSCTHKELCYHHPHGTEVQVNFVWDQAPEANPDGMTVYFYPLDGNDGPRREFLRGRDGGVVNLPVGKYRVLAYNTETPGTMFDGVDSYDTSRAYTRDAGLFEGALGSMGGTDQNTLLDGSQYVTIDPDQVWAGTVEEVEIQDVGYQAITMHPTRTCRHYTYEATNIEGRSFATSVCASLSSMSGSVLLASREYSTVPRALTLETKKEGESSLVGDFFTFGPCAEGARHELSFYVWRSDGSHLYYNFDVTDQVQEAPDPWNVHIVVDGFKVEPAKGDSPFDPSVVDWPDPEDMDIGC